MIIPESEDRTESKSISIQSWFLTIINSVSNDFGESRTSMAVNGLKKHIIFKLRVGRIYDLIRELYHIKLDLDDRVDVTVKLPKDLAVVFRKHVQDCGYSLDDMVLVGLTKFMLCKDNPAGLWESLYEKSHSENRSNYFKTIIG